MSDEPEIKVVMHPTMREEFEKWLDQRGLCLVGLDWGDYQIAIQPPPILENLPPMMSGKFSKLRRWAGPMALSTTCATKPMSTESLTNRRAHDLACDNHAVGPGGNGRSRW